MNEHNIKRLVILGGGTAGWITAALMVKVLGKVIDITLVELEKIGTIGPSNYLQFHEALRGIFSAPKPRQLITPAIRIWQVKFMFTLVP